MNLQNTIIFLTVLSCMSCGSKHMKTSEGMITKFEEFKKKEKFLEDREFFYPGIKDSSQRKIYAEKINQGADDFKEVALSADPTDAKYQQKIKIGLARFMGPIDSEEQERICHYFEELMDIVGLESSNGQLNEFRYGFNPK